jgi:hypothetical protein
VIHLTWNDTGAYDVFPAPERIEGCLIGDDWLLVHPILFERWEARGLFRTGPDHYWHRQDATKPEEKRKYRYGQLWGIEQIGFDGKPVWKPGEALWADKRVQTYYPKEGAAMGSTGPRPTPAESYDQKVRTLVEKTKEHFYVSPIEFRQMQKYSIGMTSSILKDYDYFETKEGVLIEWATLKYTGRKVKTFQSKVPNIPNPMPPSAFEGYDPIAAENFDMYLRPSGLTGLREVEWEEGPFDGVAIRLSGFWFARWGKVKGRGRVVSYVAMPTERYKEGLPTHDNSKSSFTASPSAPVIPGPSWAPNAIYTLRDADGMEVLPEVFDWYAKGGAFVDGPFAFTRLEPGIGGGTLVKKLYGRLKGGIILNAFERKPYVEPKPDPTQQTTDEVDDWDEDDDDEGEEPMIRGKTNDTIATIGPDQYFRLANKLSDKLVVMARVAEMNSVERSTGRASDLLPCVVIIDGRKYDGKGISHWKVGSIRWLLPFTEVEPLELAEKPEFTVKD